MFTSQTTLLFIRKYKKLIKNNKILEQKIDNCLRQIRSNPKDITISTHIVNHEVFGRVRTSRITGDLRIIWDYSKVGILRILFLDIGGHSGSRKVYR